MDYLETGMVDTQVPIYQWKNVEKVGWFSKWGRFDSETIYIGSNSWATPLCQYWTIQTVEYKCKVQS